jgi:3-deoxy-D-manno-octulosonic-acid transferase
MIYLYRLAIQIWYGLIIVNSIFNTKAKLWLNGRKDWTGFLSKGLENRSGKILYWFHCASLGEFEQGRPVIEKIKSSYPDTYILLTFYSPSGFLKSQNYAFADLMAYLPLDTELNSKKFLDIVRPDKVIFVKYDFWYFILRELKNRKIETFLISAHFYSNKWIDWFKRPYLLRVIPCFDFIFLQYEASIGFLKKINYKSFDVVGDVRVDRVLEIVEAPYENEILKDFTTGKKVLIAGSTWPKDHSILLKWIHKEMPENWVAIIAPHQIDIPTIQRLTKNILIDNCLYSDYKKNARVLIINNIGLLSRIYRFGTIAYIGGGFGKSIHNILEPAAYGLPVIFGPKYYKFPEAIYLKQLEGAIVIHQYDEFSEAMVKLNEEKSWLKASTIISSFIQSAGGATSIIEKTIRDV